jgi:hypothetical protein
LGLLGSSLASVWLEAIPYFLEKSILSFQTLDFILKQDILPLNYKTIQITSISCFEIALKFLVKKI